MADIDADFVTAAEGGSMRGEGVLIRGRLPSGKPNPVDVHVGDRVRLRRLVLGMTQSQVSDALNLTFQQIQKYERGTNRISASRLWDLSRVLRCSVSLFFEQIDKSTADASPRNLALKGGAGEYQDGPERMSSETIDLVRAYYQIPTERVRRQVYELTQTLARSGHTIY